MEHIIIVVNTGRAGTASNSKYISPDTKTWVGILLESNIASALECDINETLQLYGELGIKEFHFTEIKASRNNSISLTLFLLGSSPIYFDIVYYLSETSFSILRVQQ